MELQWIIKSSVAQGGVRIETSYGLESPGFELLERNETFCSKYLSRQSLDFIQPPTDWKTNFFTENKTAGA